MNLKIEINKSFLTSICFVEHIDKQKLKLIIEEMSEILGTTTDKNGREYDDKLILQNLITANKYNKIRVRYKTSNKNIRNFGRVYPKYSLSNLRVELRGIIMDNYIDIDIENCHYQIINKLLIDCAEDAGIFLFGYARNYIIEI